MHFCFLAASLHTEQCRSNSMTGYKRHKPSLKMTTNHKTNCDGSGNGQHDTGQRDAGQYNSSLWLLRCSLLPWWLSVIRLWSMSAAQQERRSVVRWDFRTELWAECTLLLSLTVSKSDNFTSQMMKKGIKMWFLQVKTENEPYLHSLITIPLWWLIITPFLISLSGTRSTAVC